jgi:hypothetical protein
MLTRIFIAVLVIAGALLQIFGINWFANLAVFDLILFTVGSVLLYIGAYYWTMMKGLHWLYSFLGLLNLVGLLIIGLIQPKSLDNLDSIKLQQDKIIVCGALSVILFVLIVILMASVTDNVETERGQLTIVVSWFSDWVIKPILSFFILTTAIVTGLAIWKRISPR